MKKRESEHQLGKVLLKKGLKDLYGIQWEDENQLEISVGEHGKPYLKNYPHIHYNITHTNGLVACGIGHKPLGVDVEQIRPFRPSIIKKVFSDVERCCMEKLQDEKHKEYFFRIWTLKESYVKALGCGITIPLTQFSFKWKEDGTLISSIPGAFFHQKILDGGYILSVCTLGDGQIEFVQDEKLIHK